MKPILLGPIIVVLAGCASPQPQTEPAYSWSSQAVIRNDNRLTRLEGHLFEQLKATHVWLLGMAKSPGLFDVTKKEPFTVSDLIDAAHGFDRMAAIKKIHITRETDGERSTVVIDMSKEGIAKGEGGFRLLPGDMVYVPELFK